MQTLFKKLNLISSSINNIFINMLTFRSPEMLAPARIPMADGKNIANILKKLPSGPLQSGNRFSKKISPRNKNKLLER